MCLKTWPKPTSKRLNKEGFIDHELFYSPVYQVLVQGHISAEVSCVGSAVMQETCKNLCSCGVLRVALQ